MSVNPNNQQKTSQEYETRIRELENELKKIRDYQDFMRSIFHDLIAKLNPLLGFASLLLTRTELNPTQHSYAAHILSAGKSLLALIYNFRDYNLLINGHAILEIQPTEFRPFLEEMTGKLKPWAAEKDLEFSVHADPNIPMKIPCDARRLRQMLENFIDNAIKFTMKGKVEFIIEFDDKAAALFFKIADTGMGLNEEIVKTMNSYFAEITTPPAIMQIGLINNKMHADLMNGKIWVESKVGSGSTFHFALPLPTG